MSVIKIVHYRKLNYSYFFIGKYLKVLFLCKLIKINKKFFGLGYRIFDLIIQFKLTKFVVSLKSVGRIKNLQYYLSRSHGWLKEAAYTVLL